MSMPMLNTSPVDFGDRKKMRSIQLEKLKRQLVRVYEHSPYYREKLDRLHLDPHRLKSLEQYTDYPMFDKQEWRRSQERSQQELRHPFGMHITCDPRKVVRVSASTGTTGKPTFQGYTERDRQVANLVGGRLADIYGLQSGDVVLHAFVLSMWIAGVPVVDLLQSLGACVVPVGAMSGVERFAQIAKEIPSVQLNCTPSFADYLISQLPVRAGCSAADLGIQRLLLTGEPGGSIPQVRERLSTGFGGAKIFDWIGATGGSFMSSISCEHNDGLHFMAEDFVLFEVVEPGTLKTLPLEDGVVGEIVFTGLEKECAPMLRWRDGDIIEVKLSPCRCGRPGLRYIIKSRADDMLLVRGVNVFPPGIKAVVESFRPAVSGAIRIILDEPPPVVQPPLKIRVELGVESNESDSKTLRANIEHAIHDLLRIKAKVELVEPGTYDQTNASSNFKAKLIEKSYEA